MKSQTKKKVNFHYSKLIREHGYNKCGIGWRNNQLDDRYDIFLKHMNFKNKIIFDYGSGICNLYDYLQKKKIKFKKYIGYDFNPDLIKFNKKKKLRKFSFLNNKTILKNNIVDFTISNGVHNYKTIDNFKNFKKDLIYFAKISKVGFGVSFLNTNVDYKESYLSYLNLKLVINEIQKLNCNFIIDQTFKKYETFLIVYKN